MTKEHINQSNFSRRFFHDPLFRALIKIFQHDSIENTFPHYAFFLFSIPASRTCSSSWKSRKFLISIGSVNTRNLGQKLHPNLQPIVQRGEKREITLLSASYLKEAAPNGSFTPKCRKYVCIPEVHLAQTETHNTFSGQTLARNNTSTSARIISEIESR